MADALRWVTAKASPYLSVCICRSVEGRGRNDGLDGWLSAFPRYSSQLLAEAMPRLAQAC